MYRSVLEQQIGEVEASVLAVVGSIDPDELDPLCTHHHDLHTHHHWALIHGTGKRAMVPPTTPATPPEARRHGRARPGPGPPVPEERETLSQEDRARLLVNRRGLTLECAPSWVTGSAGRC